MKLSKLIELVGDENIEVQNVQESLVRANAGKRDGEITFATDRDKVMRFAGVGEPEHIGLIVWLPKDRVNAALNTQSPTP